MSHIEGIDELLGKLELFGAEVGKLSYEFHDREMVAAQEEAVSLIPVFTGKARETLASPDALQRKTDGDKGETQWSFGMVTLAIERAAYYLFFVEFGTKGSQRGELLNPGVRDGRSKSGRLRKAKRRKRSTPARPATPWLRPAQANLFRRLQNLQGLDQLVRSAMRSAKLGGGD